MNLNKFYINSCGIWIWSILLASFVSRGVAIHDFISSLSDRVNELKRAVLNSQTRSSRSSSSYDDLNSPLVTDRFVSRDPRHVRFLLFDKRLSPDDYVEIRTGREDMFDNTNFEKKKPLKVLIHGFNHNASEGPGSFVREAKRAYLEHTDANVIVVDWGRLAKPRASSGLTIDVFYPIVVSNVPRVGEELGKLLVFMANNNLIQHPDQIHLIGFSLGAHVAGAAGTYFKEVMDRFIGRITGLDPAAPMFETATEFERLDKTDADFVDVIHSSRLGLYDRLGHADFYVNGGRFQADCYNLNDQTPRQVFSEFYRAILGTCGHSRAPLYFTYSIKAGEGAISGCGCSSWREFLLKCKRRCKGIVNFGEHCPPTARGMFFLEITVDATKPENNN